MKPRLFLVWLVGLFLFLLPVPTDSHWYRHAHKFGAIAYSDSTGDWGSSYNYDSREEAIEEALRRCGRSDCVYKVWFRNSCGVIAKASNGALGWSYGSKSLLEAKFWALEECAKRGEGCKILCWSCTDR